MFEWRHKKSDGTVIDVLLEYVARNLNVTEMAIEKAIDMTAKMIAKSRFDVYRNIDGKTVKHKDELYYMLNVRPNGNEKATDFWRRAVRRLIRDGECLIIPITNKSSLYIADTFEKDDVITKETTFSNITIGDLRLYRKYHSSEVIYLQNRNRRIRMVMDAFNKAYADMLSVAMGCYRIGNAPKFKMQMPTSVNMQIQDKDGKRVTQQAYIQKKKEELSSKDLEVIMLGNQIELNELTKQGKTFDDVQKVETHIKETVAFMFDIPIDVFIGKTTEKSNAMNDMITFNVSPLEEIINDGINACVFTMEEFLKGEMVEIDQSTFKHVDILDVAVQIDKLMSDGFSHDDIRGFIGLHETGEAWAQEHHITKNYGPAEGGEKKDE